MTCITEIEFKNCFITGIFVGFIFFTAFYWVWEIVRIWRENKETSKDF